MNMSKNQNQPQDRNLSRNQVQNDGRAFKFKPLISFLTVFSFLLLAFSGFILYIRPEGGLARWVGWKAIGLDKSGWETVHIVFCALFFLAGVIHLILNFKAIILYLTSGIDRNRKNLAEMLVAGLLVFVLLLMAIWRLPPVNWLMEGRAHFKNHPRSLRAQPPSADFEKQSLRRVMEQLGKTPDRVLRELEARGLAGVSPESSLEEVARRNNMTPQELYLLIRAY
ncbi:MAG: DUF4405 domain-containing protein [Candidatus Saccharicenans sp.]|nr:DUF4405 domain-containing protein [Candidatus Saccharicenans sp.]